MLGCRAVALPGTEEIVTINSDSISSVDLQSAALNNRLYIFLPYKAFFHTLVL